MASKLPHLAGKIRQFVARHQALELATAPEEDDASVPDRLGDFTIVREIGRGGMGMIYEAVQEPFNRRVALKTIRGDYGYRSPDSEERFLREQAVLAKLHHTNIVPIFAAGKEGSLSFYAMEYVQVLLSVTWCARPGRSSRRPQAASSRLWLRWPAAPPPAPILSQESLIRLRTTPRPLNPAPRLRPTARTTGSPCLRSTCGSVAKVVRDAADALHHAHGAGFSIET